jgi:alkylation response protein AidB-like acyl-CoA dehydrogenase
MTVEDVETFRARARDWMAANLPRREARRDAKSLRGLHEFTRGQIEAERPKQRKLHEAGFVGITWPVEYGGQGLTPAHERAFLEEAEAFELPDFGIAGGTTFGVCVPVMLAHASEDFKRRHLPRIAAGDELWAQFFSEPGAGSDLAGVRSTAIRDGDVWRLNGAKTWSSWAHLCDWGLCLARTNWDVPKHRGLTWFGVEIAAPGVTLRPIRQINGGADFCEEFFDDVVIPDADRVGDVDDGWTVARTMLVFEKGGSATVEADGPLEPGELAPDLVQLVDSICRSHDPVARQLVARAHEIDYVRRALNRRVVAQVSSGRGEGRGHAAYAALAEGVFDAERALLGMELARGHALAWDEPGGVQAATALQFLNGKVQAVAGGTDQMQRNAIAEQVLRLPKEPSFDRDKPFSQVLRDATNWKTS